MKPSHRFRNAHPHAPHTLGGLLRWKLGLARESASVLFPGAPEPRDEAKGRLTSVTCPLASHEVRLTWIGHSTFLVQHQGLNILTDPIFGDCQPIPLGGMRRAQSPVPSIENLPAIDFVFISHSHYDHLDLPSLRALGGKVQFWVPTGLSKWFAKRKLGPCHELGWWESSKLTHGITLHCVPAQHGSRRHLFDRDRTLWCGWVLKSATNSIYFAGDTGYSASFREIGAKFGGVDLAMIPIGAYRPRWLMQPMHLSPEEAVQAHIDLQSRLSIACHWGTFRMADEPLDEPPVMLRNELDDRCIESTEFRVLRIGQSIRI
jgi:Predicted Zn-dependent hydrolases of the beta-lactamase fold